jgi:hypothetical protein
MNKRMQARDTHRGMFPPQKKNCLLFQNEITNDANIVRYNYKIKFIVYIL